MSYVVLQLAVTKDMFIARKDGSVDFLDDTGEAFNADFAAFIKSMDVIVMGRGTYEKMLEYGDIPFKDKQIYVLTSRELSSTFDHVTFTNSPFTEILDNVSGNVWLFGGSKVINSFLEKDAINEMQIFVVPLEIGEGIPLFLKEDSLDDFDLQDSIKYDQNVLLKYVRKV